MTTDEYGIRVLEVARDARRARFRVLVLSYDADDRTHPPIPDDPSFFLKLLWNAADEAEPPLHPRHPLRTVGVGKIINSEWLGNSTHRYVRRFDRIAVRNHPLPEPAWADLPAYHAERDGRWGDEERLVQADYDIEVTDARCLEALRPGQSWATSAYPGVSHEVREADAPTVLDLRAPVLRLAPFPEEDGPEGTPGGLALSDDGRYLAITSMQAELVVYRATGPDGERDGSDWSEHLRLHLPGGSPWGGAIQWVPDTHQITWRQVDGEPAHPPTHAHDVDTGTEVEIPAGALRDRGPFVPDLPDTLTGAALPRALSPDGAYLVAAPERISDGEMDERISLWRVSDGAPLMHCRLPEHYLSGPLAWSPDGETLVACVMPTFSRYSCELWVYRAGPPVRALEGANPG